MHVISHKTILEAAQKWPQAEDTLDKWYRLLKSGTYTNLIELQQVWPSAEAVGRRTVFNINTPTLRVITRIDYQHQKCWILYILDHKEYDKEKWKRGS